MPTSIKDKQFKDFITEEIVPVVEIPLSSLDSIIQWIQDNLSPDEVFEEKQLIEWAESNDYIKE